MNVWDLPDKEAQMPFIILQVGLGVGNPGSKPLTMGERHELVLLAMQQQDRDGDIR